MARTKQHPHVGRYVAHFEDADPNDRSPTYDTAEEALEARRLAAEHGMADDGDVVYVYAIVGVKAIRKPTLTENLAEDLSE